MHCDRAICKSICTLSCSRLCALSHTATRESTWPQYNGRSTRPKQSIRLHCGANSQATLRARSYRAELFIGLGRLLITGVITDNSAGQLRSRAVSVDALRCLATCRHCPPIHSLADRPCKCSRHLLTEPGSSCPRGHPSLAADCATCHSQSCHPALCSEH